MIQRGKRIIVVESSVPKNGHPNVGDIGYLDNAYLFPKQRFILADAFFYQYKKDATKSKTRLEKKVFIIDLNMNKSLKNKIQKSGISKKYFSDNNNVINLTAVGFDPHSEFHDTSPQIFDHCGLWTSSNLNPVKIPFPVCFSFLRNVHFHDPSFCFTYPARVPFFNTLLFFTSIYYT